MKNKTKKNKKPMGKREKKAKMLERMRKLSELKKKALEQRKTNSEMDCETGKRKETNVTASEQFSNFGHSNTPKAPQRPIILPESISHDTKSEYLASCSQIYNVSENKAKQMSNKNSYNQLKTHYLFQQPIKSLHSVSGDTKSEYLTSYSKNYKASVHETQKKQNKNLKFFINSQKSNISLNSMIKNLLNNSLTDEKILHKNDQKLNTTNEFHYAEGLNNKKKCSNLKSENESLKKMIEKIKFDVCENYKIEFSEKKKIKIIKDIVYGRTPETTCQCFRVGASQVIRVLKGKFNLKTAHQRFYTSKTNLKLGNIGEAIFAHKCNKDTFVSSRAMMVHPLFKFIICQSDYRIIKDNKETSLVEIKTTEGKKVTKKPSIRNYMQVWITMEAFSIFETKYIKYSLIRQGQKPPRKRKKLSLKKILNFESTKSDNNMKMENGISKIQNLKKINDTNKNLSKSPFINQGIDNNFLYQINGKVEFDLKLESLFFDQQTANIFMHNYAYGFLKPFLIFNGYTFTENDYNLFKNLIMKQYDKYVANIENKKSFTKSNLIKKELYFVPISGKCSTLYDFIYKRNDFAMNFYSNFVRKSNLSKNNNVSIKLKKEFLEQDLNKKKKLFRENVINKAKKLKFRTEASVTLNMELHFQLNNKIQRTYVEKSYLDHNNPYYKLQNTVLLFAKAKRILSEFIKINNKFNIMNKSNELSHKETIESVLLGKRKHKNFDRTDTKIKTTKNINKDNKNKKITVMDNEYKRIKKIIKKRQIPIKMPCEEYIFIEKELLNKFKIIINSIEPGFFTGNCSKKYVQFYYRHN